MKRSFKIFKYADIPVYVHWSFILIFAWVFYIGYSNNAGWEELIFLSSIMLTLFVCVTLHEFGHALTAKRYGILTRDIILSPIGGIARLESIPEKPQEELKIALAGPLVNVGIAAFLSPYYLFFPLSGLDKLGFEIQPNLIELFIPTLVGMNLVLAAFNMLPAFPMDGGRVFRALLSYKIGRVNATRAATFLGQFLAVFLFISGIFSMSFDLYGFHYQSNIITSVVGAFIFLAAMQEFKHVKFENKISNYTVKDLIRFDFTSFNVDSTVQEVKEKIDHGLENRFLVMDELNEVKGIIHDEFIMEAIKNEPETITIEGLISPNFQLLDKEENLKEVFAIMQTKGYYLLPIVEDNKVIGVIDSKMLNKFLKNLKI